MTKPYNDTRELLDTIDKLIENGKYMSGFCLSHTKKGEALLLIHDNNISSSAYTLMDMQELRRLHETIGRMLKHFGN